MRERPEALDDVGVSSCMHYMDPAEGPSDVNVNHGTAETVGLAARDLPFADGSLALLRRTTTNCG